MKSSNVKRPIDWKHVSISELVINGVKMPVRIDIATPKEGLYLVTVDPDGNEISRVQIRIDPV